MAKKKNEIKLMTQTDGKTAKEKKSAIMNAMKSIQKLYGEGATFLGGDNIKIDIEAISSGSLGLTRIAG